MDGTIYQGSELYPTTIPFLNFLKNKNIRYLFLSNNSSLCTDEYVMKLKNMGISAESGDFYISTDYAVDYLKQKYPSYKRLFVFGMKSIYSVFNDAGFEVAEDNPDAVIIAFDRNMTYDRLCQAAYFVRNGVPAFATHPDVFCPTNLKTWLVDCGAITACIELSTGKQITRLGKPDPGFLRAAAEHCHVPVENTLMIGDRLSTDILLGINAGAHTCRICGPGADTTPVPGVEAEYVVDNLGILQKMMSAQS